MMKKYILPEDLMEDIDTKLTFLFIEGYAYGVYHKTQTFNDLYINYLEETLSPLKFELKTNSDQVYAILYDNEEDLVSFLLRYA